MDVILIPGLWLDASSWDAIVPAIERAGHTAHPLTMPGTGEPASSSAGIGISDWVDAAVAAVEALDGPVAVVGHSGGGNVAWGVADRVPGRVARVVLVDTVPPPDGAQISEFEPEDGVVPFPGWDFFEDDEVGDIDAATREHWAARAKSVPAKVPADPIPLHDERRFGVPVTLLSGGMDEASFREVITQWGPYAAEFGAITDTEVVRLDSGHWPQFSQPDRLADAIIAALR